VFCRADDTRAPAKRVVAARLTGRMISAVGPGVRRYVRMYFPSMFAVLPLVPDESVLLIVLAKV
jgi:hypothetical protein